MTALLALCLPLGARTWTSADGGRTFEGDLRTYDSATGKVTVILRNGRTLTFDQDKLSEDDIAFLKEQEAAANMPDPAEALEQQVVGAKVAKAKLQRLEGKRFKKAELTKAPEYYILYFSASW
jgi:hypothetical protein